MRDDMTMRTTVDIDDDVLEAAKELAEMRGRTAGQILSELARKALAPPRTYTVRNGVPILPRRPGARLITNADVKRWLEEDE
jgi:hypothetical protein